MAILVDFTTTNDSANGIVVSNSIYKPLHDNNANALSAAVAIGPMIKSEALPIRAQEVQCRHWHDCIRSQDHPRARSDGLQLLASGQGI
jgi:hypothetical protein